MPDFTRNETDESASGRVALGDYSPRAPTDPDVRTLAHPVPQPTDLLSTSMWSPRLFDRLTLTCLRTSMCSTCFPRSSLLADASLSSTGSSRASSPASTVLSKRYDFLLLISPHFVSFAWRYLGCTRCVRSLTDECTVKAWSWYPGISIRMLPRKQQDLPSSWGISIVCLHMFQTDAGRTVRTLPLRCGSVAPGPPGAKAPTIRSFDAQ